MDEINCAREVISKWLTILPAKSGKKSRFESAKDGWLYFRNTALFEVKIDSSLVPKHESRVASCTIPVFDVEM